MQINILVSLILVEFRLQLDTVTIIRFSVRCGSKCMHVFHDFKRSINNQSFVIYIELIDSRSCEIVFSIYMLPYNEVC